MLLGAGTSLCLEAAHVRGARQALVSQRRHASRRKIAYPQYGFQLLPQDKKIKHDSNLKFSMRQFLGPRNFKGEYLYNRYFAVPDDHVPKYITPETERGQALVDPVTGRKVIMRGDVLERTQQTPQQGRRERLQPFPQNRYCVTNLVLDEQTKNTIYEKVQIEKKSIQEVSRMLNLKIPRIEAVVRLMEAEKKLEKQNRIKRDTRVMADTLFRMFPIFKPHHRENLSEIPVPSKALSSRILTISESEPFGPIDAAKLLELEPAADTLARIAEQGADATSADARQHTERVVYGERRDGERAKFRFVKKRVGEVGFRYGSANRDTKKDRRIGYDRLGRMIYL